MNDTRNCGRCHACGDEVRILNPDGEEWCDVCERSQRPLSHGWSLALDTVDLMSCEEAVEKLKRLHEQWEVPGE